MNLSNDFYEKLILIILTAVISGFLIPWILKKYEFNKARQSAISKAQSDLLDKLSETIWRWRYLARLIPYYGVMDLVKYEEAKRNYEDKIWNLLTDLRIHSSKARQLLSEESYKKFIEFYHYIVNDIDMRVIALIRVEGDKELFKTEASKLTRTFHVEVSEKIEQMLLTIALDLKLTTASN